MLNTAERRALRAKSHALKPVVLLGQHGLTPTVLAAIDEALAAHELIKVRLRGVEREDRSSFAATIAEPLHAEVVNLLGHILTLYRAKPPAVEVKPKAPKPSRAPPKKPRSAKATPWSSRDRVAPPRRKPRGT